MSSHYKTGFPVDVLPDASMQSLPLFPADIAASSPGSSSPYLVSRECLYEQFAGSPARRRLLDSLARALERVETLCVVHAVLLGGSIVDRGVAAPRDLDAVIFYSVKEPASPDAIKFLSSQRDASKSSGLDLRFAPVDVAPHVLIKVACFFGALYSSERGRQDPRKGALLLVGGGGQ